MTRRAACRAVLALGWAIASGSHPWEEGAWARVATACELVPSALLNASSPCERGWERPSPAPREPGAAAALGADERRHFRAFFAVSKKPRENPGFFDFGGPYLGRIPVDSAPSWTVDHLCTSSRDLDTKIARIDSYKVMLKRS